MATCYLHSITTSLVKPTNSPFTDTNHQHPVNSDLMSSVRQYSNMTACCHSKSRPNDSPPISSNKRSPMEDSMIFSDNIEEIGLLDLMPCNGTNGMSPSIDFEAGIGITEFLRGKSFFVTGATGFLAKVLIEKILRTTPDVGKIYVLIKAKNKEATLARLKNEIINVELFRSLKETHGNNYHAFMMRTLIPVMGNVWEANMGIEAAQAGEISKEVDIIVNSAANTTFDERFRRNSGRPIHVTQMKLFNDMKELSSHVHSRFMKRMSMQKNASQKFNNITMKLVDKVMHLATIYEPYTFYRGRFDATNAQNLIAEMSEEEKREFGFDGGCIDWEDNISNVHITGLRKHVLKRR